MIKKWIINHKKTTVVVLLLVALIALYGRLFWHLSYVALTDENEDLQEVKGVINDASRLESTKVIFVEPTADEFVDEVRKLIIKAKKEGSKISIGGSRHSMGGHTSFPGGYHISTSKYNKMTLDKDKKLLTVQSGAIWTDVIRLLDKNGLAVKVMQSNCSFSIGGSLSANCHGWQHNKQPIGSTVQKFTLMNASGDIVTCSRDTDDPLFQFVVGGYGLFGVILEVTLEVCENEVYKAQSSIIKSSEYVEKFNDVGPETGMVYGRFKVSSDEFLEKIHFVKFQKSEKKINEDLVQPEKYLSRLVFRGSALSDYGKNVRWKAETGIGDIGGKVFTRNQLCFDDVKWYRNNSKESTDILHEYFIPEGSFELFVKELQRILPAHNANLLNITVRNVLKDENSFLSYAKEDVFGFVMLFNQKLEGEEQKMEKLTRELITAAQECGGTFYLPYRRHATHKQLLRSYPKVPMFFEAKKKFDPSEIFQNKFYLKYRP